MSDYRKPPSIYDAVNNIMAILDREEDERAQANPFAPSLMPAMWNTHSGVDPMQQPSDLTNTALFRGQGSSIFSEQPNAAAGCPNGSVVVSMEVTAYTSGPESTGKRPGDPGHGITASGTTAGPGTFAAPRSYAFGTKMYVPGYGWGTVQDRGGAIQGNHLDVWFETVAEARAWGRQQLDVIVCRG